MVSSGKVSCIVFVMHVEYLLAHVHVHVLEGVNSVILEWIHVHVCVAPPIVVGAWKMATVALRYYIQHSFTHTYFMSLPLPTQLFIAHSFTNTKYIHGLFIINAVQ